LEALASSFVIFSENFRTKPWREFGDFMKWLRVKGLLKDLTGYRVKIT